MCTAVFAGQIMKTDFVPKLVASVSACCAIYAVVTVADRLLTVKTLASVGYFDALVRTNLLYLLITVTSHHIEETGLCI